MEFIIFIPTLIACGFFGSRYLIKQVRLFHGSAGKILWDIKKNPQNWEDRNDFTSVVNKDKTIYLSSTKVGVSENPVKEGNYFHISDMDHVFDMNTWQESFFRSLRKKRENQHQFNLRLKKESDAKDLIEKLLNKEKAEKKAALEAEKARIAAEEASKLPQSATKLVKNLGEF